MASDRQMVTLLTEGRTESAIGEIVSRYGPMVHRTACRITGDPHLAEDVSQAVFCMLLRKGAAAKGIRSLGAWLHHVAIMAARDTVKREARRRKHEMEASTMSRGGSGIGTELPEGFDVALDRLAEPYQQAIVLRFLRGMSRSEAAHEMGVDEPTVDSRTARGLERLRRVLAGGVAGAVLAQALSAEASVAAKTGSLPFLSAAAIQAAAETKAGVALIVKGTVKAMFWMKMKAVAAALCAAVLVGGGTVAAVILQPADSPQSDEKTTEMGKLAASMKPGTWAELKTKNIVETLASDGASGALFGYSEDGAWDPKTRQWFYIGGDHNGIAEFVCYSADTNTWKRMPRPAWIGTIRGAHTMHGYDHNALNPETGDFYHLPFNGRSVHKYRVSTGVWSTTPPIATDDYLATVYGVEYFPELGGVVVYNGGSGSVYLFSEKEQQWKTLASKLPQGGLSTFAEYSPAHKVMILGGGQKNPQSLYKLDSLGKVTALKQPPVGLGGGYSITTVDPVSGDFLVFGTGGTFHSYDVSTDTWKPQTGTVPIFSPIRGNGE